MSVLRTDIGGIDDITIQFQSEQTTYAGRHLARQVMARNVPIISRYDLYILTLEMFKSAEAKKLYLRSEYPSRRKLDNLISELQLSRTISRLGGLSLFNVLNLPTPELSDAVCLADQYCSVAYMSAIQRWGLSERNPKALLLSRPNGKTLQAAISNTVESDAARFGLDPQDMLSTPIKAPTALQASLWPSPVEVVQEKKPRDTVVLRGTRTRISSLPQTLVDTLTKPELCGGMNHVLDMWSDNISDISENAMLQLISLLHESTSIVKVRAGYILDERLGLIVDGIEGFVKYAQRGGSRVLDPQKPFAPRFSEKWMLSINV
jgi:predicted transcriptional regulator of viral defense system